MKISNSSPTGYKPQRPDQFIGPAREMAAILERIATRAIRSGDAIKILLRGDPGIGKSALAETFITHQLGVQKWSLSKYNGTQLKIDDIDAWSARLAYPELLSPFRVLWIEEVDKCNSVVQTRLLTVLDDLPHHTAVICTSNKSVKDFEPRFQSRFQVFSLQPPPVAEIEWLLKKFGLRKQDVTRIANFCCGNVRLALFDGQSALDESGALKGGAI